MITKFSNKEAINYAWTMFRKNLLFFITSTSLVLFVFFLPALCQEFIKKSESSFLKIILYSLDYLFQVLSILLAIGYTRIALRLFENKKVNLYDLFIVYDLFFKYLISLIIYNLIVLVGMFLFLIPGIVWAIKFRFFPYFIIEGFGIVESFTKSSQITEGYKWNLLVFFIVLIFIILLGFLMFGLGLLIAFPLVSMAMVFVYKKLNS